ncbi:MAG: hypothetical protein AB1483_12360 [Candidatus Zixiibacteriota bacterium]
MRKLILFAVIIGLALSVVVGCGDDDDTPTTPIVKDDGELNDPEFLAALEAYYTAGSMSDMMLGWIDILIDTVFEDSALLSASGKPIVITATSDSVYGTYHSTSNYWYFYASAVDTIFGQGQVVEDIVTFLLEDSIQFLHGTTPVQWPDSTLLTAIKNGVALTLDSGEGDLTAGQFLTLTGDIVMRGDVTLTGSRSFDMAIYDESDDTCTLTLDMTTTASSIEGNLTVLEEGGCPSAGSLTNAGIIGINCSGDSAWSFNDNWVVTETFYGDSSVVVFENTTTRWTFTDYCESGITTKPLADIMAAIKP